MKRPSLYDRLLPLARRARPRTEEAAPFGATTRIVARWQAGESADHLNTWERLSAWGAGLAVIACTMLMIAVQTSSPDPWEELIGLRGETPVQRP